MEEENHGPGAARVVLDGQIDNVAITGAVEEENAIEEAGVLRMYGGALRLAFGVGYAGMVGCAVRCVSGWSGVGMSGWGGVAMAHSLRPGRRGGERRKRRRNGECGDQNGGQMAAAAHWGKDTVGLSAVAPLCC
jgi:hypothetical protein